MNEAKHTKATIPSPVVPDGVRWTDVQKIAHKHGGRYGGEKWYFTDAKARDQFVSDISKALGEPSHG